ncbi:uncharacterized protein ASCRUDRAFT_75718 [Ascoidea rubescens DSM 1968]|uniref:Uncharacterized protein n=1 Tax=Ascoidea rubescens DSM 1968 TaxID=1344418 RepID=A0A1D2VHI1_9ASCO|nr:hypothetical protein ASCRUDRAFT_75718 [Ascoidea rubescens DSM 1968]ODV60963.1 hypothetical protein ASCRUDRAFT_75718 [Ascoidea rubescens DSM 1968]
MCAPCRRQRVRGGRPRVCGCGPVGGRLHSRTVHTGETAEIGTRSAPANRRRGAEEEEEEKRKRNQKQQKKQKQQKQKQKQRKLPALQRWITWTRT